MSGEGRSNNPTPPLFGEGLSNEPFPLLGGNGLSDNAAPPLDEQGCSDGPSCSLCRGEFSDNSSVPRCREREGTPTDGRQHACPTAVLPQLTGAMRVLVTAIASGIDGGGRDLE
uniref:Uncharacterized protein n=1 Tax=Chromera velia CCMP2878 TaxID=1169474 RepID=A0A0G4H9T9_9ALVE|eukprot:Cvel_25471.t1-p1 / transcript=Cvel_25471.t1 / gene=Cvel_25471 / organism=Chromera_velia_CCMP2878 / gene_product=hypothetical protein / transcript_product=hypothetical protein / location=Cvel_scaffold2891:10127-10465(+) / protein_length=113 / sequence_SO=supercontig / SO=protein_coding / is_pseudo=false